MTTRRGAWLFACVVAALLGALAIGDTARSAPTADMSASIGGPYGATPGSEVSLSFSAGNNGPERAQNPRVSVTLTLGTSTFVSLSAPTGWSCNTPAAGANVDSLLCSAAQLSAGQIGSFDLVIRVKPTFTGTIALGTRVGSTTADSVSSNDTSTSEIRVRPAADVSVSLSGPAAAPANTTVKYTVTLRNNGPSYASSVVLSVDLPDRTWLASVSSTWSGCLWFEGDPSFRCSGSLYVGQVVTVEFWAKVDATATGSLTARARAVYANDPNGANDDASLTSPVTNPRADVAASVSAFDFTAPGGTVNYAIRVLNNGPDTAYEPGVRFVLPAQTTFVGLSAQTGGSCRRDDGGYVCDDSPLAAGSADEYYLTVRVNAGATGSLTFSPRAQTASTDPTPENDVATKTTTVADAADVGIELSGPANVEPGSEVAYDVTVTNNGPGTARDVSWYAEDYPGTFVSLTAPASWQCNPPDPGATSPVGCNLASLESGASATFELVVQLASDEAGPISNNVTVASLSDPNGANDDAQVETTIGTPPPTAPGAPRALTATAGAGSVALGWSAPASDGGSPVTGYDVYAATASGGQGDTPLNATPLPAGGASYTATGLVDGQAYFFTVRALNGVGRSAPSNEASATPWAPSSVVYDGEQLVASGFRLVASARVSGVAECTAGRTVTFSLDRNPLLGVVAAFVLGTATADAAGRATVDVATGDWLEGGYTITATVDQSTGCGPASAGAALTVGSLGTSAGGSGWYSLAGSGRVSFGFDVRRVTGSTYSGTLRLTNDGRWRLRGSLTSYVRTSDGLGTASGVGELAWWNPALDGGRGDWQVARADAPYTIEFTATGANKKTAPGTFGIRIGYTPVGPQPSPLPSSGPQSLAGGTIALG